MNPIKSEFEKRDVQFLAVNVFEEAETATRFAETSGYGFLWARTDDDSVGRLGIEGIPAVIVLDKDGNVAWRSGLLTTFRRGNDLREALQRLTKG